MIQIPVDEPTGDYLQRNVDTLMQVGGLYSFVALAVELDHADTLQRWRIDHESKSVVEYLQERNSSIYIES